MQKKTIHHERTEAVSLAFGMGRFFPDLDYLPSCKPAVTSAYRFLRIGGRGVLFCISYFIDEWEMMAFIDRLLREAFSHKTA